MADSQTGTLYVLVFEGGFAGAYTTLANAQRVQDAFKQISFALMRAPHAVTTESVVYVIPAKAGGAPLAVTGDRAHAVRVHDMLRRAGLSPDDDAPDAVDYWRAKLDKIPDVALDTIRQMTHMDELKKNPDVARMLNREMEVTALISLPAVDMMSYIGESTHTNGGD